jgi:hypothetical protein
MTDELKKRIAENVAQFEFEVAERAAIMIEDGGVDESLAYDLARDDVVESRMIISMLEEEATVSINVTTGEAK